MNTITARSQESRCNEARAYVRCDVGAPHRPLRQFTFTRACADFRMTLPECPICLEKLRLAARTYQMRCGHRIHTRCALEWTLRRHTRCPICRRDICTHDESDTDGSEEPDGVEERTERENGHASEDEGIERARAMLGALVVVPGASDDAVRRARGTTAQLLANAHNVAIMHQEQHTAALARSVEHRPEPHWARRWRELVAKHEIRVHHAMDEIARYTAASARAHHAQRRLLRVQRRLLAHWRSY